jgi:hypothetical protein
LVWLASVDRALHGVVDFEDAFFDAIAAVSLFVLLPDDGKLVEDCSLSTGSMAHFPS